MTNNDKTEVIGIRVSKRVLTRAKRVADASGIKVGEVARQGLLREIVRMEREVRDGA